MAEINCYVKTGDEGHYNSRVSVYYRTLMTVQQDCYCAVI